MIPKRKYICKEKHVIKKYINTYYQDFITDLINFSQNDKIINILEFTKKDNIYTTLSLNIVDEIVLNELTIYEKIYIKNIDKLKMYDNVKITCIER